MSGNTGGQAEQQRRDKDIENKETATYIYNKTSAQNLKHQTHGFMHIDESSCALCPPKKQLLGVHLL